MRYLNYFYDKNGKYKFDPKKLRENHERNFEAFCKSLHLWKPIIIVDNTNIKRLHFQDYIKAAQEMGYIVKEVEAPVPDPATAAKRNLHGVSEQAIRRMIEQYDK